MLGGAFVLKKYAGFLSKVAKSGFYIILFLCISAIGISGYVMYVARNTAEDVRAEIGEEVSLEIPFPAEEETLYDAGEIIEEPIKPRQRQEEKPAAEPKEAEKKAEPKKVEAAPKKEKTVYTMALSGAISAPFSGEELIKSKTMEDWRTHRGVDIVGELGADVLAIADGEVISVEKDSMFGNVVRINHGDGLCSIYAALGDEIAVKKGARVRCGDKIGVVGNSALCEFMEPPHLHLEVTKNDKHIDPLSLFPAGDE